MAYGDAYTVGTASTDQSSPQNLKKIFGSGTGWSGSVEALLRTVLPGDLFWSQGYSAPIASVEADGELTLRNNWPGPELNGAAYSIEFLSGYRHTASKVAGEVIDLVARLRLFETAVPVYSVKYFGIAAPVGDEVVGDYVVVSASGSGAFSGHDNEIARKTDTGWFFTTPEHGYAAISGQDNFVRTFDGLAWSASIGLGAQISYTGAWNSGTAYTPGNVVTYLGAAWVAQTAHTNSAPSDVSSDWDAFISLGISEGFLYTFSTDTANSNPGSGGVKLNGSQAGATVLRISALDALGNSWSWFLAALGDSTSSIKGHVRLVDKNDQTRQWLASVTSVVQVAGSPAYFNVGLSAPATPQNALTNGAAVLLQFRPKGDKGDTGNTGNTGNTGARGLPGGPVAIALTVDTNSQTDSDPGNGKIRFSVLPQNTAGALRVSILDSGGASTTNLIDSISLASTSDVKANGRLYDPLDDKKYISFNVISVQALPFYRNLAIQVTGSSSANPFSHGAAVTLAWVSKGDKGNTGTLSILSTVTGEPGTSATVVNAGTASAAALVITIPRGDAGRDFHPTHVVNELVSEATPPEPDRSTYEVGPVTDDNGNQRSVLVLSDVSNGGLPTLYFLEEDNSPGPAVWSPGITFGVASQDAADVEFNPGSSPVNTSLAAANVEAAILELERRIVDIPDPFATALIFGD